MVSCFDIDRVVWIVWQWCCWSFFVCDCFWWRWFCSWFSTSWVFSNFRSSWWKSSPFHTRFLFTTCNNQLSFIHVFFRRCQQCHRCNTFNRKPGLWAHFGNLVGSQAYKVRVVAGNNYGWQEENSATAKAITPTALQPQQSTEVSVVDVQGESVSLQLNNPSATAFDIYLNSTSGSELVVSDVTSSVHRITCTDSSSPCTSPLISDTLYTFRILAKNNNSGLAQFDRFASDIGVFTTDLVPTTPVTNLRLKSITQTTVAFSWTPDSDYTSSSCSTMWCHMNTVFGYDRRHRLHSPNLLWASLETVMLQWLWPVVRQVLVPQH